VSSLLKGIYLVWYSVIANRTSLS